MPLSPPQHTKMLDRRGHVHKDWHRFFVGLRGGVSGSGGGVGGSPPAGGGTGDVVGPASAVDDHLAIYDGTTGKLIADGGQTIDEVLAEAATAAGAGDAAVLAAAMAYADAGDVTTLAAANAYTDAAVAGLGTGDVVGPASAGDDRIATYDGTTGKLIQDGGQTIADVLTAADVAADAALAAHEADLEAHQSVATLTLTGTQHDVDFSDATFVKLNNASDLTITGLLAGFDGQEVVLLSVGAGQVYFAHANVGSVAANRLNNTITLSDTPIFTSNGAATFRYNATTTRWVLVQHHAGQSTGTVSSVGTQNDVDFSNVTFLRLAPATDLTITGFLAGYDGQEIVIYTNGAGNVYFNHLDAGSAAGNRLFNTVTVGPMPLLAAKGTAIYRYSTTLTRWQLVYHNMGGVIAAVFAAGNFTGNGTMTWTVAAGDVGVDHYTIVGRTMFWQFRYNTTTVGGAVNTTLTKLLPGLGNTINLSFDGICYGEDNGTKTTVWFSSSGSTGISFQKLAGGNWTASADLTKIAGNVAISLA